MGGLNDVLQGLRMTLRSGRGPGVDGRRAESPGPAPARRRDPLLQSPLLPRAEAQRDGVCDAAVCGKGRGEDMTIEKRTKSISVGFYYSCIGAHCLQVFLWKWTLTWIWGVQQ